jgi:hypothetical protein|tara:strand:+ start:233 stop:367 length:135 start_codon:yes stop_codon:yes gene_type:complete
MSRKKNGMAYNIKFMGYILLLTAFASFIGKRLILEGLLAIVMVY